MTGMGIFEAFVLGVVQGLGEFLPVSSSAHLVLVPWLMGWDDPGLGFDVALHWGTLLAVLVYFRRDVMQLAGGFVRSMSSRTRDFKNDLQQRLVWLLVVASVPGAIIGKLLQEKAETVFRNPALVASTLGVFGLVLLVADRLGRKQKSLAVIEWWQALAIGCSQALAIIPGVSRSGSTIAAGLGLGFQRADAARFSFLMSIPIIFGAGLVKARHFGEGIGLIPLGVGFVAAAVFGFLSIDCLMRYVGRRSFGIFAWYRLAVAAGVLAVFFLRK